MSSPTQRTLAYLRKQGWTCGIVEKWIPQTRQRLDFLGGIDLIAVRPGETMGIQATSRSNQSARIAKLQALPTMQDWMNAGNRLCVIGWSKQGARGKRKLWSCTITELLPDRVLTPPAIDPTPLPARREAEGAA